MLDEKFHNIDVSLNHGTTKTDQKDVIYIGEHGKHDKEEGCIAITVEEAKWLVKKLPEFIDAFEQEPYYRVKKLLDALNSGRAISTIELREELNAVIKGLEEE